MFEWSLSLKTPGVKADDPPLAGPLPPPGPLLVGVSGGGDSVALLHILRQLAPARGWRLIAGHVNHGLRDESGLDEKFVSDLAGELGLQFMARRVKVAGAGRSPEEAARLARRRALGEMAASAGAGVIALAHTADDQAETLLYRLLIGAGPTGLAGMRPFAEPFWRPLLDIRRKDLRDYLCGYGLKWREDPTNQDLGPLRNRVRHKILPLVQEMINPRAAEALCRLAAICADEEDYWENWGRALGSNQRWQEESSICLSLDYLRGLQQAPARRLLRQIARELTGNSQGLSMQHVGRMLALAAGPPGRRLSLPGGLSAYREQQALRLDVETQDLDFTCRLDGPGWVWIPSVHKWLAVEESSAPPAELAARGPRVHLPAREVVWPLTIRSPRAGERFHPMGAPGSKKLSRFLIDQKAPLWRRRRTVVVEDKNGLWWAAPWSLDERARKKGGENRWLSLSLVDTSQSPSYT